MLAGRIHGVSVVSWMALKNFTLAEFAKLEQDCFSKNSIWALALQRPVDVPDAILQPPDPAPPPAPVRPASAGRGRARAARAGRGGGDRRRRQGGPGSSTCDASHETPRWLDLVTRRGPRGESRMRVAESGWQQRGGTREGRSTGGVEGETGHPSLTSAGQGAAAAAAAREGG